MTDEAKYVLNGFIELSESEKEEFIEELQFYLDKESYRERQEFKKSIRESVVLGPTSSGCPCCGK